LRAHLRRLAKEGVETLLIPHHIGYPTGYRGINWTAFTSEFWPVVEIVSFHGLSEHTEAPYPFCTRWDRATGTAPYSTG
jgi:hypothetical protein